MQNFRADLQNLRENLHRVHGVFLDALKYRFEQKQGHAINATQWFMILTQDPEFEWARPLTRLATDVDILLDEKDLTEAQVLEFGERLEKVFATGEDSTAFGSRFLALVPQDPDLMLTYHRFREARKKIKQA